VTWQPGSDRIAELVEAGELASVPPDDELAQRLVDDAQRHLCTAEKARDLGDLSGAYQLAYDAFRKSAAALLAPQGLRATSRGGHIAIQEAVVAQFSGATKAFSSFGRIRRSRNNFEYPSTDTSGPDLDDVNDAIDRATQARHIATGIIDQNLLTVWVAPPMR
jgi:hypothetical protein